MIAPAVEGCRAGCDLVDVEALGARLDRTPALLHRIFSQREVADARRGGVQPGSYKERERLAARAAGKEAAYKALGIPGLRFRDLEVRLDSIGRPLLYVRGVPSRASISLSHDGGLALAFVVMPQHSEEETP